MPETKLQFVISAKDEASKVFQRMQNTIKQNVGVLQKDVFTLNKWMALGLAGVGVSAVKMAADFDNAMRQVNVMARVGAEEFDRMKKGVLDLSDKTAIASKDMADAMYIVVSAGFRGADALKTLEGVALGAAGGMADARMTAEAVTKALNIFGFSGEKAGWVMDRFFGIVDRGLLSFEELARAFPRAASQAGALGVSFDEVGAALAVLTKVSASTEEAATALNATMTALSKPTEEMTAFLNELGYATSQVAIQKIGFVGILKSIEERYGGNAEALAKLVPNVQGLRAVLPLVSTLTEDFDETLESLQDSSGRTSDAFEEMASGPGFRLRKATNELKNSMILLGDELVFLVDVFVLATEKMKPFTAGISALGPSVGKIITQIQIWNKQIDVTSSKLFDKLHLGALKPVKKSTEELKSELDFLRGTMRGLDNQLIGIADRWLDYQKETRSATEILEDHKQKQEELQDVLEQTGEGYTEIGEKAKKTMEDIRKLDEAFREESIDAEKQFHSDVISLYIEAKTKYTQLGNELAEAEQQGRQDEVADIERQMAEQKKIISDYLESGLNLGKEINLQKQYLAMSELQRLIYDYEQKKIARQQSYEEERAELTGQTQMIIGIRSIEHNAYIDNETKKSIELKSRLIEAVTDVTKWKDEVVKLYNDLAIEANKALSSIKAPTVGIGFKLPGLPSKQSGGYIPETGAYLLHKGETVVPAGGFGGAITVNIMGGNYLSREAAVMFGKEIADELKRNIKL